MQLRECCQAPFVDPGLYVAVTDSFEVNHRRGDVAVSHPLLQGPDVDAVLEVPRGIRVAEFVEEPTSTVRSFGTAIDLYGPVFQLVAHSAMTALRSEDSAISSVTNKSFRIPIAHPILSLRSFSRISEGA
jgi:hypothetical protein